MPHIKRPRDVRGWTIPSKGTLSYHIYLRLAKGQQPPEIAKSLGLAREGIAVLAWGIRNPDAKNQRQQDYYKHGHARRLARERAKP